jgi:steroid 5-alpha reductase family enzyme
MVDTAWGGGFVLVAIVSVIANQNSRTELIFGLVLLWGLRLASHIWQRSISKGPDPRYKELTAKWGKQRFWLHVYTNIFLLQGSLIWVVSLPIMVAGSETTPIQTRTAVVGTILWLIGFIFESMADRQLNNFVKRPANKGKVMQTGLWRYSRHPNYFGELLQWWAIALLVSDQLIGLIGLIGPLVLTWLIVFVSGIPPIEKRRLNDSTYQNYKKRTSPLVPWPLKH